MPIYEYICTRCGNRFEVLQKATDPPLRKCRTCQGELRKVIAAPALQFKGNGWYITDYARKSIPEKQPKPEAPPSNPELTGVKNSGKKGKSSESED